MADLLHGLIHDTGGEGSLPAEENDQVRLHDFLIARAARGSRYPFLLDTQRPGIVFSTPWCFVVVDPGVGFPVTGHLSVLNEHKNKS